MNRARFKAVARDRLKDAEVLLAEKRASGAYYLVGYAVECGLKACIAKQTKRFDFPPRSRGDDDVYVHDPTKLLKLSGLKSFHDQELATNAAFKSYWNVVKDWKEDSRYGNKSPSEATDIHRAVTDPDHGVMRWLAQHW